MKTKVLKLIGVCVLCIAFAYGLVKTIQLFTY